MSLDFNDLRKYQKEAQIRNKENAVIESERVFEADEEINEAFMDLQKQVMAKVNSDEFARKLEEIIHKKIEEDPYRDKYHIIRYIYFAIINNGHKRFAYLAINNNHDDQIFEVKHKFGFLRDSDIARNKTVFCNRTTNILKDFGVVLDEKFRIPTKVEYDCKKYAETYYPFHCGTAIELFLDFKNIGNHN